MYAVVVFALALLSPLPFVSPFDSVIQDATAQSSTNVPFDAQSLEIVSNLDISPFGVIQNGTDGFDSIVKPRKINTFQIGDSIYAGVHSDGSYDSFTIVNITDPSSPSQVSVLDPTVNNLFTMTDAAYTVIDGSTYAISVSENDDRVLIINVSNPSLPSLVTYITDGTTYPGLDGPSDIAIVKIDTSTFALVTAKHDRSVQIINITDPSNPSPASTIYDGVNGYTELNNPYSVTTVETDTSIFALVAARDDNGVQIINITDPYNPTPAYAISNNRDGYTQLHGAYDITTITLDSTTYALVAARYTQGIQIIDVTDPSNPSPVSAIRDGVGGYTELYNVASITTITLGASTFALAAAVLDSGIQIINITDPYNPSPVSAFTDNVGGYNTLSAATYTVTTTVDGSIYAFVTAPNDNGIQIIKLEPEYIPAQTSNQNRSLEIVSNLDISPFGVIQNGTDGFDSIVNPLKINTFQIGNSIYAGVHSDSTADSFTIMNITDPSSPQQVSVLDPSVNSLFNIDDAAYTVIDGSTYAISISIHDDRVLIINVSNPSIPSLVTYVTDGANYTELDLPFDITTVKIGSSTFALVAAHFDHGVQIIDITDPSNPIPASAITDGEDGYTTLSYATSITTVTLDSSTFALVAGRNDNGIQIVNITDPYNPTPASAITHGNGGYTELYGSYDIATVTLDSSTFAIVAGRYGQGVQIVDITDPYNPAPVSAMTDGVGGYTELYNVASITPITIGASTFVLAAAVLDSGIQIINITDPYNPTPAYAISDNVGGYDTLSGSSYTVTTTIDDVIYAFVTANNENGIQIIKLEHEYISAYTSNQNPKYAKAGDTLGISFTTSDTIASHSSQILGLNTNATVNDAIYNAIVPVPSAPRESYATFTIKVANANGESVTVTENDISSNVFIDTISPSIELVGSADYTIPYGTLNPSIPNVTVSDGDPNYLGGFTLVKNATVDTTIPGSVYIYTYTANSDAAGNPGSTISRIVTVTDTSSSETPQNLIVSPFGVIQNGVNGFDSIERPSRIGTFQIGDSIYAGVSGNFSFTIVNITDPSSPSQVTVLDTTVDSMFALSVGEYVVIDGFTYAISGSDDDESVLIINISNPSLPSLVTHITHGADYTGLDNPFGITTVTINSSTYALVTAFNGDGVQIIDITDPSNPSPVSVITDGVGGYKELDGAIHVTTVTIDSSTYALVASVWDNGVQIIDITDPYNPAPASAITNGVGGYTELFHPHAVTTVTIDSSTFAIVTAISGDGVQIIDITDPYNPAPASAITDGRDGFTELDGPYGITITTIGASTYAIVASVWGDGVQIIDITDPYNPTPASAITDGVDGYTELHRAIHVTTVTIDSSTYALVAGKYDDGIQIIKIEPEYISAHTSNQNPPFEITPNLAISPFGVIQNGTDGFDSIVNPLKINTFQIGNSIYAGVHSDSTADSFTIMNITDPSSPQQVSVLDPSVNSLFNIDDAAYTVIDGSTYAISISIHDDRVLIINVSNPSIPSLVTYVTDGANYTELDLPFDITTVKIGSSTFALVAAHFDHGVQIIDITDPSNPIPASAITDGEDGYTTLSYATSITTVTLDSSTFALVAGRNDNGIQIVNITDPYNPTPASAITHGNGGYTELYGSYDIATVTLDSSTFAIVAGRYGQGVQIVDITDPYNPAPVSAMTDGVGGYTELYNVASITPITIGASTFVLAAAVLDSGIQIINITDPYNPTPAYAISDNVGGYDTLSGSSYTVTTTIDDVIYAFVTANNENGIQIIKLEHEYISAYTSNQNPKYAKAGDTLGISFTTSDTIASHSSQILGLNTNATVNDAIYNAIVPVPSAPRESYATFTIKVANANGTSVTVTENDISSNVFIDTISPSIELVGSADYTIPYGTLNPSIPNVTVSDGDPNYLGGFTLVKSATVDTTISGSVYSYTYTANPDGSGNAGNSVTRTISVVDNSSSNTSCMDPESSYNIITGNDSSKVLNGTTGNDLIYGTEGNDIINGLGGNDCIFGNGGDDMIDGGDGHDVIHGGYGNDIIKGGDGDDAIDGESGHDDISGDSGDDALYGGDGKDIINGNAGNDALFGDGNDDTINGNGGNDVITGGSGHDIIAGGPDNDTLYGGNGDDTINGNDGDDELFGDGSDDTINGNAGNDVISGGSGHDAINGNDGDDVMVGGLGDDIITGGSGKDTINGSAGDDELFGGGNDDTINGNDGNDLISGGYGHDTLYGESGHDTINGDGGNDVITGGFGNDVITGGSGHDIIVGTQSDDTVHVGGSNSGNYTTNN